MLAFFCIVKSLALAEELRSRSAFVELMEYWLG